MGKVKRALISVSNKRGIVELVKTLHSLDIQILSTGGTSRLLKENGIPLTLVAEYTKSPEMLEGRVKTLHPKIHAGLLAKRDNPEHMQQLTEQHCLPIDMVVVNLYPFEQTIANTNCTLSQAIENIDIGGPTMLRSAAKNFKDVVVVVDPEDYGLIGSNLLKNQGEIDLSLKFTLMKKTFAHTAHYDTVIMNYLEKIEVEKINALLQE